MNVLLRPTSALVLALIGLSAHATVLDFEGLPGGTDGGGIRHYPLPLTTQGYLVASSGGIDVLEPSSTGLGFNYTGSAAIWADDTVPISIAPVGGGTFDLLSLDVANLEPPASGTFPGVVVFTGIRALGGTVTRTYTIPLNTALNSVSFSGFTGLSSFTIDDSQSPGLFGQYDNVVVQPTPTVPGPLAALPFALMAIKRRRRKA